jgi:heterodisulfide reductase subunit C
MNSTFYEFINIQSFENMDKQKHLSLKQIDYCMECGLCTGSCPISRELSKFSPRQMIKQAVPSAVNCLNFHRDK